MRHSKSRFIEDARRVGTGAVANRTYRRSESVHLFFEFTRSYREITLQLVEGNKIHGCSLSIVTVVVARFTRALEMMYPTAINRYRTTMRLCKPTIQDCVGSPIYYRIHHKQKGVRIAYLDYQEVKNAGLL